MISDISERSFEDAIEAAQVIGKIIALARR